MKIGIAPFISQKPWSQVLESVSACEGCGYHGYCNMAGDDELAVRSQSIKE